MNLVHLVKALAAEVRCAVRRYRLPVEGEEEPRRVTVYEQIVPEEVFADSYDGAYHPYIVVSLDTVEDGNQSEADVSLTFSIYGLERTETAPDGTKYRIEPWINLLDLIDTVRLHLLSKRLVAHKFRLVLPLAVEIPTEHPVPYWEGGISARYLIYQPQDEKHCSEWRKD